MAITGKRKRGGRSSAGQGRRRRARNAGPRKSGMRMNTRDQLYFFKRMVADKVTQGGDAIGQQAGSATFLLTDVPNSTEFTQLFDRFKICGIRYRWTLDRDTANTTNTLHPVVRWVHDFDDASVPGLTDLLQYPGMKEWRPNGQQGCSRWYYIKPARLTVGYESATLSSYEPVWKGFVDCASNATPFYGIKYVASNNYTSQVLRLQCQYFLAFKNVR